LAILANLVDLHLVLAILVIFILWYR